MPAIGLLSDPALASMPVFVAATGMSVATASICAATMAGSSAIHAVTATEFCAVIAVIAEVPWTRCAAGCRRSAWTPAPPRNRSLRS